MSTQTQKKIWGKKFCMGWGRMRLKFDPPHWQALEPTPPGPQWWVREGGRVGRGEGGGLITITTMYIYTYRRVITCSTPHYSSVMRSRAGLMAGFAHDRAECRRAAGMGAHAWLSICPF